LPADKSCIKNCREDASIVKVFDPGRAGFHRCPIVQRNNANNVEVPPGADIAGVYRLLFPRTAEAPRVTSESMRFTIKYKLFLTLLVATLFVVGTLVFLARWSFERGFLDYVNRVEQEVHSNLVANLAGAYREHGSWDFLRQDPRRFREIHRASVAVARAAMEDPGQSRAGTVAREPPPKAGGSSRWQRHGPPFPRHRRGRVCLLDEKREAVTSCRAPVNDMRLTPIRIDDDSVGYLAVAPRKTLSADQERRFSEKQQRFLLLLGLCIALVSVLVSFPVSRQLVKPVKKLAEATRKLSAGQYQTRIPVQSSDELGDLSRDFNSLALALENSEKARQQWIADISHELRTPLSVLRGEIEALQDGLRDMSVERLQSLHRQVMNLNRLVDDLYELSMSDIGALNYHKQATDAIALLRQSLDSLHDDFDAKQITVTISDNERTVTLFADGERLQQLFSNLLTNALRYTDTGGEVRVSVAVDGGALRVTVEDSEPGVAEEDIPRLFERLYRVEDSRNRETGGTGLGLAICRNIVDAHGGSIRAARSGLGGLKITVELPTG